MTPTCDDPANALLPWHLNGTLDGGEAASLRAHLDVCSVCTRELRELAEIGAAAHLEVREFTPPRPAPRIPLRTLAAALLLPALLGVAFAIGRYRSGAGGSAPAGTFQPTANLDLGAGPVRGADAIPRLAIPLGTERVAVTLLLPVIPEGPLSIQLRGPSGKLLAEAPATSDCDKGSGCTYSVPAALVSEPGRYAVIFAEPGSNGDRGYSYPFIVGTANER